jgi:AsmA protein
MEPLAMKALKYLMIVVLTLVVLAILTLVCVALFVNPNHFKTQIEAAVAKTTGRTLAINGNIRWSFFPWLGLGVQDVSLSNAKGFGQTPFASLGEVDVSVKFLPLLRGNIDVGTVKLTNLQVNLVKQANGQTNWADLVKSNHMSDSDAVANTSMSKSQVIRSNFQTTPNKYSVSQMIVDRIIVNNAKISWQNMQENSQKTVMIDSLAASNLNSYGDPFSLFVALRVSGPANQQPYDLNFAINAKLNNDTQKLNVSKFLVALNNLQIDGNLQVTQLPRF